MPLSFTNTRTGAKARFRPTDPTAIGLYVCGPTVYDRAHLGNARSAVVFDLLFRLLRHSYGPEAVTYARNFTDIDDKIIAAAQARHPEMQPLRAIAQVTRETIEWYHEDMDALGALRPNFEPRATAYIPAMLEDIDTLIASGAAYACDGHVFFSAEKNPTPGYLSGRTELTDESVHRIEPNPLKRHPSDFVLWKPAGPDEPGWDSPWSTGRPGWHIECSAMSTRLLGTSFDIHGGGSDLVFPHHDNEVAQATCCNPDADYARTWMHNGMITVGGQKMSKSLGNFTTVADLRDRLPGGAIRLALLSAHYRASLDWTSVLEERSLAAWRKFVDLASTAEPLARPPEAVLAALSDDLNTAGALAQMHALHAAGDAAGLRAALDLLGIGMQDDRKGISPRVAAHVDDLIEKRRKARENRDFATSDLIRDALTAAGITLEDSKDGTTWRAETQADADRILAISR